MSTDAVGLLIGSHIHPAAIPTLAALAENEGFDELWLTEDLWFTSGVVCAAGALAATKSIPVGLGIQSAVTRHPSVQALDFATLAAMYPGRFWPGIGLGLPVWLDQMGIHPSARLRTVREAVQSIQQLLAGKQVSLDGTHYLREVSLAHPPADPPPMYVGAVGPKSIQQTARIADGLVASVTAGVDYVRWSREQLIQGSENGKNCRIATFALYSGGADIDAARDAIRPTLAFYLTAMQGTELMQIYGIETELAELAAGGMEHLAANIPAQWIDDLTVVGDGPRCAAHIRALLDAGSDSVVLFPAPFENSEELVRFAGAEILPLLHPRQ